jgi:glucose-6-phosphate 1-dehydrogenase
VVDGTLKAPSPLHAYVPGTWGPVAATALPSPPDHWHDPV